MELQPLQPLLLCLYMGRVSIKEHVIILGGGGGGDEEYGLSSLSLVKNSMH